MKTVKTNVYEISDVPYNNINLDALLSLIVRSKAAGFCMFTGR